MASMRAAPMLKPHRSTSAIRAAIGSQATAELLGGQPGAVVVTKVCDVKCLAHAISEPARHRLSGLFLRRREPEIADKREVRPTVGLNRQIAQNNLDPGCVPWKNPACAN